MDSFALRRIRQVAGWGYEDAMGKAESMASRSGFVN